jgi:hypothetical protein
VAPLTIVRLDRWIPTEVQSSSVIMTYTLAISDSLSMTLNESYETIQDY